jgi:hypothetical protein
VEGSGAQCERFRERRAVRVVDLGEHDGFDAVE